MDQVTLGVLWAAVNMIIAACSLQKSIQNRYLIRKIIIPWFPSTIAMICSPNALASTAAASYKSWWKHDLMTSIDPEDWNKAWCSNTATQEAAYKEVLL